MTTLTNLCTGLGGAIGSAWLRGRNQLVFVEFSGRISALDLVRPVAATISSGSALWKGTWTFDFETGAQGTAGGDVFWHQHTSTVRSMDPIGKARIINLGVIDFDGLSAAEIQALPFGTAPINGNNDASNQLVNGDVFAVLTNDGNYAKVQVTNYDYNITVRWVTYKLGPAWRILGTGYTQPEDVVVTAGERYAYVTERSGNLLRVDLSNANRGAALVVSAGMTAPHQIALDEDRGYAYVVEFAPAGRLLRIQLGSGAQTVVASGLDRAIGLVLSADRRFAYISEQATSGGRVSRIEISTGRREQLVTGLTAPFFLRWADETEGALYVTERDPANRLTLIDLRGGVSSSRVVVPTVPFRPSSAAVMAPDRVLLCSDTEITDVRLSAVSGGAGLILKGIGHVPADAAHIKNGYADTSDDPSYFFQVKDCPFGGTLPVKVHHLGAWQAGARYYKLVVNGGLEPRATWSDYLWDAAAFRFVPRTIQPDANGFYRVRTPGELWYNESLGYMLNTTTLANGLHTVGIRLFSAPNDASELGSLADAGRSVQLRIDNRWPSAIIDAILHDGVPVGTCGIVDSGSDQFTFNVTAHDPEGHLLSWHLGAMWGDNRSATVAQATYTPTPTRQWSGIVNTAVPAPAWHATVAGDATSRRCAHTFYLTVWDRVIDGHNYLHRSDFHKSITIMLP